LLRHPANLNLGSFVQFVLGYRGWSRAAGLALELLLAGFAFVATAAVEDDRYGCGFSLWLVLITMLSPVAWPQFLVCVVPLYVGVAAANDKKALPRRVLNAACASYVAGLFMGGPLGFLSPALARSIAGHMHASYVLPAEAAFISLGCAYFAALWMTTAGAASRADAARVESPTPQVAPRFRERVSN
jgi:hypothetical protein